jgi:hypothetical protein
VVVCGGGVTVLVCVTVSVGTALDVAAAAGGDVVDGFAAVAAAAVASVEGEVDCLAACAPEVLVAAPSASATVPAFSLRFSRAVVAAPEPQPAAPSSAMPGRLNSTADRSTPRRWSPARRMARQRTAAPAE